MGLRFTTAHGVTYYLYFTDVSPTFGGAPVYDFSFTIIDQPEETIRRKCRLDSRVSHTICSALDHFLNTNDHVVLYVPLDDDRATNTSRMKVFDAWYDLLKPNCKCGDLEKD